MFAKSVENHGAADRETAHSPEDHHLGYLPIQSQEIGEQRSQGAQDSNHVQPHRRVDGIVVFAIVVAKLQKHRRQADRSYHDYR